MNDDELRGKCSTLDTNEHGLENFGLKTREAETIWGELTCTGEEGNINTAVQEIRYKFMGCIQLSQDRIRCWTSVHTV
jgi:trehalose utilization protein